MDIAFVIPAVTGCMVFASILLAGTDVKSVHVTRNRRLAWSLGILSQVILQGFAILTGYFTFSFYLLPAVAFGVNLYKSFKSQGTRGSRLMLRHLPNREDES